jgi:flagella basal body P-ring formation protein FlgA
MILVSPMSSRAISKPPMSIPIKEITDLISAQRAYEMNSKIIQAADEMASVVSKNLEVATRDKADMTFRPSLPLRGLLHRSAVVLAGLMLCRQQMAQAGMGTAVVPERTIYPGEELLRRSGPRSRCHQPEPAGWLRRNHQRGARQGNHPHIVAGPDHPGSALRDSWAVERGKTVQLVFSGNGLTITAAGTPLENAAIGDFIRVRNIESGLIVSGTVMDNGSIRVAAK